MKGEGCKSTFSSFIFTSEVKSLLTQPNQHLFFLAIEDLYDHIDQIHQHQSIFFK